MHIAHVNGIVFIKWIMHYEITYYELTQIVPYSITYIIKYELGFYSQTLTLMK